jgi:1,4-alpha-glucan branching enzyme
MVSRPVYLGGLGFSMKWNMGWMNDTLDYMAQDPIHRRFHHERLTFGQLYAYTENFVLPLSHDEVVHGKGSLLGKMPGDEWQRFANVRDLNHLYVGMPALHDQDFVADGFSWIDCHDADQSVISWLRWARDGSFAVVLLNLTPVPRKGYRIGVPRAGEYRECFNSDSRHYGGSDLGNAGVLTASEQNWMGRPASIVLTLPPLAGLVLVSA